MQIDISHIPQQPWVYLFKDSKGTILYIWKAKNLQKRVSQYFTPNSLWKQEMVAKASKVDFFVVANESESLYLENNLIKKHKPFFNCMLKWWNGYTYIKFSDSDFPQVLTTRNKKNDKATYIWPKHNTKELKKLMQYLRTILKYRTCPNSQFKEWKICSDFYFWLCGGWCEKCKNKSELPQLEEEYKNNLQIFSSFFKWNTKPIEKVLLSQIDDAVAKQNFEWASQIRDIYMHIEELVERQHVELWKNLTWYVLAIKKIAYSHICVLLNFYEWKLIDIIRQEIPIDDGDIYWIKSWFEAEIWDLNIQEWNSAFSLLAYSNKVSFNKEEKSALINMLEWFFDSYVISSTLQWPWLHNQLLEQLQSRYKFKNFPNWVECVDISHMNGDWISGWLSCIVWWIPDKRKYRKYKIKSVSEQSDDYASLKEVMQRRFLWKTQNNKNCPPLWKEGDHEVGEDFYSWNKKIPSAKAVSPLSKGEQNLPDVFILDWWIGQLNVVKDLCKESGEFYKVFQQVDFVSLWKWEARRKSGIWLASKHWHEWLVWEKIYRFVDDKFNIEEIPLVYDQADRFLVKLRDEAHRFSNSYRKQQMRNELKSEFKKVKK